MRFLPGLLVSYSNQLEVLDPKTGEVWLKTTGLTGSDGGDLTSFAVADAAKDRLTVLAVEMVNDTSSNLLKIELRSDNAPPVVGTLLQGKRDHCNNESQVSSVSTVQVKALWQPQNSSFYS